MNFLGTICFPKMLADIFSCQKQQIGPFRKRQGLLFCHCEVVSCDGCQTSCRFILGKDCELIVSLCWSGIRDSTLAEDVIAYHFHITYTDIFKIKQINIEQVIFWH